MFDFRLKVFDTVAQRLSFTKAAQELHITQPAVTKHIKEIEQQFQTQLFTRLGNSIALTPAGHLLLKHTQKLFSLYNELTIEMHQLQHLHTGKLRIGASTTIAQYVLPAVIADFKKRFPEVHIQLRIGNTEQVEHWLKNQKIEMGFIEGATKSSSFKYTPFTKDEIVLVCRSEHPLTLKESIAMKEVEALSIILREAGSGTLENLSLALKPYGIQLNTTNSGIELAHTESIKSYLIHSDSVAFLSIHSILGELKTNRLAVLEIENLRIDRYFYLIETHGNQNAPVQAFKEFALSYNFK